MGKARLYGEKKHRGLIKKKRRGLGTQAQRKLNKWPQNMRNAKLNTYSVALPASSSSPPDRSTILDLLSALTNSIYV